MESVKIVLLCIVSAVIYGILHDQVTARVCVEYFTIGHPPMFSTNSPLVQEMKSQQESVLGSLVWGDRGG